MTKKAAFATFLVLLLPACSLTTQVEPTAHPNRLNHIFVEHRLSDGRHIDELIARELRSLGYDASAGPLTMMPDGTEAIVAYQDEWTFDFTTYLIELDVAVREVKSGNQIAVGRTFRPSFGANNPATMVRQVIDPIFKRK